MVAGEASGDVHGADLISRLRHLAPGASIRFFGGDLMARAAGHGPIVHMRSLNYMGFWQVITHSRRILGHLRRAKAEVDDWRPDVLVLIDYPGFNLKLARYAHARGVTVYYYIPPKVWAWKEWRIRQLRRYVDRIFSILPFETEYYRSHGMEVDYVGNPSVIEVDRALARDSGERSERLVALVPGSRESEVRHNLPVMLEVARAHPEWEYAVAAAPSLPDEVYRRYLGAGAPVTLHRGRTLELMARARAALVTSGTATLECALASTPQVAMYRGNASPLTYHIMRRLLHISFVTLPNLIAGRHVIPELLLHRCTSQAAWQALEPLLNHSSCEYAEQMQGYADIRRLLTDANPAATVARYIASTQSEASTRQPLG